MTEISQELMDMINAPERIGVLATADPNGRPNIAYFGSLRMNPDQSMVMGLGNNRTLANLKANGVAAFMCLASAPVSFETAAARLYLKVKDIDTEGAVLKGVRDAIAAKAGEAAAKMIAAGVTFEVTEVRGLVDMG